MYRYKRATRGRLLTSVLAGSDQVDDVGMLAQFAQHLQLPGEVSVVVLRGKLCRKQHTKQSESPEKAFSRNVRVGSGWDFTYRISSVVGCVSVGHLCSIKGLCVD